MARAKRGNKERIVPEEVTAADWFGEATTRAIV
jgi:hypothetical protein